MPTPTFFLSRIATAPNPLCFCLAWTKVQWKHFSFQYLNKRLSEWHFLFLILLLFRKRELQLLLRSSLKMCNPKTWNQQIGSYAVLTSIKFLLTLSPEYFRPGLSNLFGAVGHIYALRFHAGRTILHIMIQSKVAESEVKCPTPFPTPTFQIFPTPTHDSNLSKISDSRSLTQREWILAVNSGTEAN